MEGRGWLTGSKPVRGSGIVLPHQLRLPAIFGWVLGVLGLAVAGVGLSSSLQWIPFALRAENASAVVERVEWLTRYDYAPFFRFRTTDGRDISARSIDLYRRSGKGGNFGEGQMVLVYYDPADPSRATGDTFTQLILKPLLLLPMGLVPLLAGIIILRARPQRT